MTSRLPHFRLATMAGLVAAVLAAPAHAALFSAGDLIVTGTTYSDQGQVSSLVAGSTILSGGKAAVSDGSFNTVFNNSSPDGSFGVTSQIFVQGYTGSTLNGTYYIDPNQAVTSFSSKSELAIGVSTDGSALTIMGYNPTTAFSTSNLAPVSTGGSNNLGLVDISNSNTPGLVDSTNLVNAQAYRTIVQLNLNSLAANGANTLSTGVQTYNTNAYSGNNGRAVVLSNGNYYIVGNAGNGSGNGTMLSQLSDNTGVQMLAQAGAVQGPGGSNNTTVVGAVNGTYGNTTGYQRGFSTTQVGAAADKTGKDDNFRSMTVYNGNIYVTKGSGGNGVDTVYEVGAAGSALPTTLTAGTTPISVLPGMPTGLATNLGKTGNPGVAYTSLPFATWFANPNTLYVAYEGAGKAGEALTNGASGNLGGIGKWTFDGSKWNLQYVVQGGLGGLVGNFAGLGGGDGNVYADGIRQLTGKVNGDGTVTLYGVTSTVTDGSAASWDQGANPDQIVALTDTINATSSNASFTVLETSAAGSLYRGVALAPVPEPETWGLMVGGLAVLGALVRRRSAAI